MTRVVDAFDGELYVAANFDTPSSTLRHSLFQLDEPTTPIVTWESGRVIGVDTNLRSFGNNQIIDVSANKNCVMEAVVRKSWVIAFVLFFCGCPGSVFLWNWRRREYSLLDAPIAGADGSPFGLC